MSAHSYLAGKIMLGNNELSAQLLDVTDLVCGEAGCSRNKQYVVSDLRFPGGDNTDGLTSLIVQLTYEA